MPLVPERQKGSNWCWAACLRVAAAYFGRKAPTQAALATQFIAGAGGCDVVPPPQVCDQGLDDRRIPTVYGSVGLIADALSQGNRAITQATIDLALRHGIVLLNLDLPSGFHFVLVSTGAARQYSVADPHYDQLGTVTWDYLSAYQDGHIAQAWRVFAR